MGAYYPFDNFRRTTMHQLMTSVLEGGVVDTVGCFTISLVV